MKQNVSRNRVLMAIALTLLGVYALMSFLGVNSSLDRLQDAESDLVELNRKLDDIRQLSSAPRIAAFDLELPDAILNRITDAIRTAGLPADALSNQVPMTPQRVGQTDFLLRKIEITLAHAPLAKIVAFCDALKDESTGSVVRDLNLSEPKMSGSTETWRAQMTLTQMIFSPKSDS
ncbi:hypothetical protein [Stieleria varia]|uniref:General secretion pathway protein M n=1 Tax=Stieleria varia TaxID=2528005 RepID=A0A5C6AEK8_9BACT|nr:hypothetical protein [Stieleria varia]TWT98404.1 hypothetical protein Pla52n_49170 [Stieleria varia]